MGSAFNPCKQNVRECSITIEMSAVHMKHYKKYTGRFENVRKLPTQYKGKPAKFFSNTAILTVPISMKSFVGHLQSTA